MWWRCLTKLSELQEKNMTDLTGNSFNKVLLNQDIFIT